MKTSLAQNQHELKDAVMFPAAVRPEEICPCRSDLMPRPEELAAYPTATSEHDAFEASRQPGRRDRNDARIDAASENPGPRNDTSRFRAALKPVEFHLHAPLAGWVRLAADFTDWEQSPLDMIKFEGGVWSIFVPLRPGNYAYHFIVDGEQREDPRPVLSAPDPGAPHAVVKVTCTFQAMDFPEQKQTLVLKT